MIVVETVHISIARKRHHKPLGRHHLHVPETMDLPELSLDEVVPGELETFTVQLTYPDLPFSPRWEDHRTFVNARLAYLRELDRAAGGFRSPRG